VLVKGYPTTAEMLHYPSEGVFLKQFPNNNQFKTEVFAIVAQLVLWRYA
jgi:hypothetical protein